MTILKLVHTLFRQHSKLLLEHKNVTPIITICRYKNTSREKAITYSNQNELDTNVKPLAEKVKEGTKTASYLGIILFGVGVTGTLFYAVFNELFSSQSPNNIYTAAAKKCIKNTRIEDKLGLPITAYGEETRRGRRQHPSYLGWIGNDGKKHLRMKFYLQGAFHKGTAQLEMVENDKGKFEYRYLLVQMNDLLETTIILEDNRGMQKEIHTPNDLLLT